MTHHRPVPHGTTGGYTNWKCRCRRCTRAHNLSMAIHRKARFTRATEDFWSVPHGPNGYTNYGCRCETCKQGSRDYLRSRREQAKDD